MKNKSVIIFIIIAIVAILIGGYLYYNSTVTASTIFTKQIDQALSDSTKVEEYKTLNSTVELSGNLQTQSTEYTELANMLNTLKVKFNVQSNLTEKTEYVALDVDYENEKLIGGHAYYTNSDKNIYVFVDELFDKYFKANVNELDDSGEMSQLLDDTFNSLDSTKIEKANQILKDEINNQLKEEYFSQTKVDNTKKSTLKLTVAQLKDIILNICKNLQNNQEFLNCYSNPDEVKNMLTEIVDLINTELNDEDLATLNFEMSLYTKGLLNNEIVKVEITLTDNINNATFNINKIDDENYEFHLNITSTENNMTANVETLNGTLKIDNVDENTQKMTFSVNIPDLGTLTINLNVSSIINKDLDSVDVSNNVDVNNLSDEDATTISTNLQKMKIYELISSMSNSLVSSMSDSPLEYETDLYEY